MILLLVTEFLMLVVKHVHLLATPASYSSRSSASSASIKAEAERAALLANQAKKELLALQSQIAAHIAKVTVLKSGRADVQSSRAHSNGINSYLERPKSKSSLKPSVVEFVPQNSNSQFHHSTPEGIKSTVPVEANPQLRYPPIGDSKSPTSMGA